MAVDELREINDFAAAELRVGKKHTKGDTRENGQEAAKTLLFASILGIVVLVGVLHFGVSP